MILHVVDVKYVRDYVIWVKFNDGIDGEVDLSIELEGEVFGPLKDKALFLHAHHTHLGLIKTDCFKDYNSDWRQDPQNE